MLFTIIKERYVTVDVTFFEDSPYYPPHSDEKQNNSHTRYLFQLFFLKSKCLTKIIHSANLLLYKEEGPKLLLIAGMLNHLMCTKEEVKKFLLLLPMSHLFMTPHQVILLNCHLLLHSMSLPPKFQMSIWNLCLSLTGT